MTGHTLRSLLKDCAPRELQEVHRRWHGGAGDAARAQQVAEIAAAMSDPVVVQRRLQELPRKLADLLESVLQEPQRHKSVRALRNGHAQNRIELDAALAALQREGLLFQAPARDWDAHGEPGFAVPGELADCIDQLRRTQQTEVLRAVTLRGFLQVRLAAPAAGNGARRPAAAAAGNGTVAGELSDHARKIYKLYLMDSSIRARIRGLPAKVRAVFDHALTAHGGIAAHDELRRALPDGDGLDLELVRKCLEEAMLGTVAPLSLARYGIQPCEPAVILFAEIVLLVLQANAAGHVLLVDRAQCAGVDLVSNLGRFLRETAGSKVQFTVEGRLYRASAKRIQKAFHPVPGEQLDLEAMVTLLYRFCLGRRLIDRRGERGLRVTDAGHAFEEQSLQEKTKALLAWCVEERDLPGEPFHQVRLRRVLLRLLKRIEPERWYETPHLPLLARNAYLTRLDELQVDQHFAPRVRAGHAPGESLQQIAWHLLLWVKRRLYPLGLVDLGLRGGRPVALRLTRFGAELLGNEPAARVGGQRSSVIVNPDFDVLLYPGEDEHEVVHTFDRFAERTKSDGVHHYRLTSASVAAGLRDGLTAAQILQVLTDRSRTPLPQNVVWSLEDWADGAKVLVLAADGTLRARRSEHLDEALQLPQLRQHLARRTSPTSARLAASAPLARLCAILQDRGYCVARE
jgi:hypothetical protein